MAFVVQCSTDQPELSKITPSNTGFLFVIKEYDDFDEAVKALNECFCHCEAVNYSTRMQKKQRNDSDTSKYSTPEDNFIKYNYEFTFVVNSVDREYYRQFEAAIDKLKRATYDAPFTKGLSK